MSTSWYCCDCGDGPHGTLMDKCHCQHTRCSNCSTGVDSEGYETTSECGDLDCNLIAFSNTTPTPRTFNLTTTTSTLELTALTTEQLTNTLRLASYTPTPTTSTTITDLPSSEHHTHTPSGQGQRGDDSTWVWYCCSCGNGPNNYTLDKACPFCYYHKQCRSCTYVDAAKK